MDWTYWPWINLTDLGLIMDWPWPDLGLTLLTFDRLCWSWTDFSVFGLALLTLDWLWTNLTDLRLILLNLLTLNWPCWPCIYFYELLDLCWYLVTLVTSGQFHNLAMFSSLLFWQYFSLSGNASTYLAMLLSIWQCFQLYGNTARNLVILLPI